jgi:diacylglycerol kinase family enzyme
MVDVTLVHNPSSGDENHDGRDLRALLERHGHEVRYQSVRKPGLEAALARPADVVAVAAGDGTVANVMRRLVGSSVPLALLPSGTANNIAMALGAGDLEAEELVERWPSARRARYVLGEVDTGVATSCFAEAVGGGLVAAAIDQRWELSHRLEARLSGKDAVMPELPALRAERVAMTSPTGASLRLDDRLWSPPTNRFVARCNLSVVVILP